MCFAPSTGSTRGLTSKVLLMVEQRISQGGRLMRLPLSKTLILILSFAWNSLGFKSLYGIDFAKSHILLFFWIFILCFLTFMYCLLLRQLDRDCEFLEAEGIMDYSLLIGLHFRDDCSVDEMKSSPRNSCSGICIVL